MPEYLTEEQLNELKKKLKYLETVKTREVAKMINDAASFGDLSENAAYSEAKEKQSFLQKEIAELRETIKQAKIIKKEKTGKVQIGSIVSVELGKKIIKFEIVSQSQADPLKGKISYQSPVGKALLGKSAGDKAEVKIDEGEKIIYSIKEVK